MILDSAQYDTGRSFHHKFLMIDSAQYDTAWNLTPRSMIPMYCAELDSAHYDTARRFRKIEYLSEDETKKENIVTHWSVAQAGWNDEKN